MQLNSEYDVAATADALWPVLNDVERVAPFVPGFELVEADGETYRGTIKVKVGAITVSYNAEIEVLERDERERRVVMEVSGRERRGPGSVHARVTSTLEPRGEATRIALVTDVQVTGRVAQFGSGVLGDVSASLLRQFVGELERDLTAPAPVNGSATVADVAATSRPAASATGSAARPAASARRSDVLDIGAVAGPVLARRLAPAVAAGIGLFAIGYLAGRRR
jgi:carbon monoxide dehydrogenase subunit G